MRLWTKWLPWRYVVRRLAASHGFLDPLSLLAKLTKFAQPSEIGAPIELLRAGVVFHARGLVNTKAIQSNLDWVWPYWVVRQFDPRDESFVPRSFSITHVNLTHRNWTAVGVPGCEALPIVDPRGLVTPFYDGWSMDAWIVGEDGTELVPSREKEGDQQLHLLPDTLAIETNTKRNGLRLQTTVQTVEANGRPLCRIDYRAIADRPAKLAIALRPYNPEGISFIKKIELLENSNGWIVNGKGIVRLSERSRQTILSNYRHGDVHRHLNEIQRRQSIECEAEMATAAAVFEIEPGREKNLRVLIDLTRDPEWKRSSKRVCAIKSWEDSLANVCRLSIPDSHMQFLFDAAVRSLILHSPKEVWPGPYTYKRFWFRDAAFIVNAMLCMNMIDRSERVLSIFPGKQTHSGYFLSQEGEWDANGEALWTLRRFAELSGKKPGERWRDMILRGGDWFRSKRTPEDIDDLHAGLLPAGFSAEHLGNNDNYLWDDFWAIAGLESAAFFCGRWEMKGKVDEYREEAASFRNCIEDAVRRSEKLRNRPAYPASPHRRMDSGAIGSLACGYPLQTVEPNNPRLMDTVEYLLESCFVDGAFFQDMIHSGWNIYLTLHVAQVLLRAGDKRYWPIVERVAELASPTGQWPEAVNPRTHGGCMGDGQHIWAAADWLMMLRNMFVREEEDELVFCSGIPAQWLQAGERLAFGPAPTPFGVVEVAIDCGENEAEITVSGKWRGNPPRLSVHLPGRERVSLDANLPKAVISLSNGAEANAGHAVNAPHAR